MEPLTTLCRDTQRLTSPQYYRRVATRSEERQVFRAVDLIRILQFVRNQFRLIFEYLEEANAQELRSMEQSERRADDWVKTYIAFLERLRFYDTTIPMVAAAKIYATANGRMADRLEQLDHPIVHTNRAIKRILEHPRGDYIEYDEAYRRFQKIAKGS